MDANKLPPPYAWDVYIPSLQHGYIAYDIDDDQKVDDLTNHEDAVSHALYTADQMQAYARQALADRERQAGEAVAQDAFAKALSIRTAQGWSLTGKAVPVLYTDAINGEQVCRDDLWLCTTSALASLPAPKAVQAGWKLVPPPSLYDGDDPRSDDLADIYGDAMMAFNNAVAPGQRGFSEWCDRFEAALEVLAAAAAPSPDGKAEQAEAPSDYPQFLLRKCEHCGCKTNAKMRACCKAGWVDDKVASEDRASLATQPTASNAGERLTDEQAAALWRKHLRVSDLDGHSIHGGLELVRAVEDSCRSTKADGHALMPFEPTDEMEVAAENAYEESGSHFPNWKAAYRAMRDAALASKPPAGEQKPVARLFRDGSSTGIGPVYGTVESMKALDAVPDGAALYLGPQPEQVAQDREDAARWRELVKSCGETPLRPAAYNNEILPDRRLKIDFPTIVSLDAVGNVMTLAEWVDAARARGEGERS